MDEILGLIIIAILWAVFAGLKRANRMRPGQPGQKTAERPERQPTTARPTPRTYTPDRWPNIESLLTYGDETEEGVSHGEGAVPVAGAPAGEWGSIVGESTIRQELITGMQEGTSEYTAREIPASHLNVRSPKPPEKPRRTAPDIMERKTTTQKRRTLSPAAMRNAVILSEIIAPPKSRRRRVS